MCPTVEDKHRNHRHGEGHLGRGGNRHGWLTTRQARSWRRTPIGMSEYSQAEPPTGTLQVSRRIRSSVPQPVG